MPVDHKCQYGSLVPRPSITANVVEGLVKFLRRMTSGGHLEACCACTSTAVHQKCHASRRPPDVNLRRSFTRPSTTLAVIEGLGTRQKSLGSDRLFNCSIDFYNRSLQQVLKLGLAS